MKIQEPLSTLQLELLKIYSFSPNPEDLIAIKTMLGKYFANKMTEKVNKAIEQKNITENDLENWLHED